MKYGLRFCVLVGGLLLLGGPLCAQDLLSVTEGPVGNAFWDAVPTSVSDGLSQGDIYWVRERDDAPPGGRGWNVIYVTEGVTGQLRYVSGEIYIPRTESETPRRLLVWASGTVGFEDSCAPSRGNLYGIGQSTPRIPGLAELLARGYVVAATDYEGLGTPGGMPFANGRAQAQSAWDAARAAIRFARAGTGTEIGMYGFSLGGQTVLWAAHIANQYAPELELLGIAPAAPASRHVELSLYDLGIPQNAGYFVARMAGLAVGKPDLRLRDILTEAGLELLASQAWGCFDIFGEAAGLDEPYAKPEALEPGTPWRTWLEANDQFLPIATAIPILLIQGDVDIDVPVELTRDVRSDLCERGLSVEYVELADVGHFGAVGPMAALLPDWFDSRFGEEAASDNCVSR